MLKRIFIILILFPISAFAKQVHHSMGTTNVPDNPKRIVVLTNEGTEAVLALGGIPVGAAQSWIGDPWYPHISDVMKDAVNVGIESKVNLELVAALQPDLILGNRERQEKIYPQLSAIAPTVLSERLRGDWRQNFRLYALALNKETKGKELLDKFDTNVANLAQKLGNHLNEHVSVVRFLPAQIRIYQLDSFSGFILKKVGFKRPANQNVNNFAIRTGKESIPDMDGDRIFYFTYESGDGKGLAVEADSLADPMWKQLNAVKAGKVHKVDDIIWNTSGGIISAETMLKDIAKIYELK